MIDKGDDNRAVFSLHLFPMHSKNVALIVDEFDPNKPTRTVTNDIERVLEAIFEALKELPIKPDKLVYIDTDSRIDEIVVDDKNRFLKFQSLQPELQGFINKWMETTHGLSWKSART